MDPLRPQLYTVVGGPLDGEEIELPAGATQYVSLHDGGRGADTYRVERYTHRDADGRALWERLCLVWQESAE